MRTAYDFIVIGQGGIGSAAAYRLARAHGGDVLALERFALGHDAGASQDHSRIIRLSYHAAEYTALTPLTYRAWGELEAETGVQLVVKTGGLDVGEEAFGAIEEYAGAMTDAGIPFRRLTASETMAEFPQWRLDGRHVALYQEETGLVDARKGNQAHQLLARAHGATILDETPVTAIRPLGDGAGVEVVTDAATFTCRRLVVAADAWTNQVLAGAGVHWPLTTTREQVTYWATPTIRDFAPDRFPTWIWHGEQAYYGFPVYGEVATKAGIDVGGDVVDPDARDYVKNERADEQLRGFLDERIPGYVGPELYTKTCLYTMPPDRQFTVDTLPDHPQIAVCQGAAHAYKFAALLGEILCELATTGSSSLPIDAFSATRPALTDPSFTAEFNI